MFNLLLFSVLELDFEGIVKNTEVGEVKLEKNAKNQLGQQCLKHTLATRGRELCRKPFPKQLNHRSYDTHAASRRVCLRPGAYELSSLIIAFFFSKIATG